MNTWFPLGFVLMVASTLGAFMGPIFAAQAWGITDSPWMIGIAMWAIIDAGLVVTAWWTLVTWLADR